MALGALACSAEPPGEVHLATWWGQRGEFAAPFQTLQQSLRDTAGLDVTIVSPAQSKYYHMQWVDNQLEPDTESPTPLDVVAYNNGGDVLRSTHCGHSRYAPHTARLRPVDDATLGPLHIDRDWIDETFDPEVLRTVECDHHYYALPVGLHQVNTLFYNKRLLRAAGFDVNQDGSGERPLPSSLDEFEAAVSVINDMLANREGGIAGASAIALPRSDSWTLSLFFIENIMLASAGPDAYQQYWGGEACDASLFESAMERVRALDDQGAFSDRNLSEKNALEELAVGNAAFMVTGDWAVAEIDDDVGYMPFPGTRDLFVFTADVFAMPDTATSDVENGFAWLRAVTGLETQREFAQRKHALSARRDDPERPQRGQVRVRSLPAFLPGTEIDAPSDYKEAFQELSDWLLAWLKSEKTDQELKGYAAAECDKLRAAAMEPGDVR